MKFISLKVRLRHEHHGYDEHNNSLDEDHLQFKSMEFREVIIPLSDIASIGKNHISIKEAFGRLRTYEYEKNSPDFFEELKEKLREKEILIN
jgi:hypothetical protein